MKKTLWLIFSLLSVSSMALATQPFFPLDKITFQTTAKQWVTTQSALVTVMINATLPDANLVKARADIMNQLNTISAGEWHLIQFDRSQDSSGLEKLAVTATARLNQNKLTHLYQQAKAISKPGISYTIGGIEFKPSMDEIQAIKLQVRKKLYVQVADELTRINTLYPQQSYSINELYITDGDTSIPKAYQEPQLKAMRMNAVAPETNLVLSNEIIMNAMVTVASNRRG